MNNAEKYFNQQKQSDEFVNSYNEISEQIDIEWELERVKKHIAEDYEKNIILEEIKNLQNFIHQATFLPKVRVDMHNDNQFSRELG